MRDTATTVPVRTKATRQAAASAKHQPSKHQQRTDATRNALLKSARRIFARDGFEACRIEDIAADSGRTRGAFYAHFSAKEDLFFALLEEEAGRRIEQIHEVLQHCANSHESLTAFRRFYVNRLTDRRWAMLMLEFKLFALRHPKLHRKLAATHRRIRAALRIEGIDRTCGEPQKAVLEAVLGGMTLEHAYDPRRLPKRECAELAGVVFDAVVRAS